MEGIRSFINLLLLEIFVFIPCTILVMLLRMWVIKKIMLWKLARRYKHYLSYGLDPIKVPVRLHELIPLAKKWGLPDDERRRMYQNASREDKVEFARAIRGKEVIISHWMSFAKAVNTKEVTTFRYLLKSILEMDIVVEPANPEKNLQTILLEYPQLSENSFPLIYYAPRPKSRLEKIVYDLFNGIIVVIIFPLFYYLIGKFWLYVLPNFQPDYGIAILSLSAIFLSMGTFALSKKLIFRLIRS